MSKFSVKDFAQVSLDAALQNPPVLTPQSEGGFTVTSPLLPELVTEGDSLEEALENAKDALAAYGIDDGVA